MSNAEDRNLEIQQRIEALSEELVLMDPADFSQLGKLHSGFEQIRDASRTSTWVRLPNVAKATAQLVEKIILREITDASEAIETLGRTLSAMQELTQGRSEDEVSFPKALEVDSSAQVDPAPSDSPQPPGIGAAPPRLPDHIDPSILTDFLARQPSVLEELEK
jgi:hypothetical protein